MKTIFTLLLLTISFFSEAQSTQQPSFKIGDWVPHGNGLSVYIRNKQDSIDYVKYLVQSQDAYKVVFRPKQDSIYQIFLASNGPKIGTELIRFSGHAQTGIVLEIGGALVAGLVVLAAHNYQGSSDMGSQIKKGGFIIGGAMELVGFIEFFESFSHANKAGEYLGGKQ